MFSSFSGMPLETASFPLHNIVKNSIESKVWVEDTYLRICRGHIMIGGERLCLQELEQFMGTLAILAYLIDWGWLRIGPPYIYINIDPVIFRIGPLALRWYGLMYAVAILAGLRIVRGYATRKGITQAMV